jgi:glycosyltransferase involved in cell wall biosynthesis
MEKPAYSVIVPVYNSEPSLRELFEGIRSTFEGLKATFEVIFVEDHGQDNSWEVLKSLKSEHPEEITAIRLSKNYGQHNATFCGMGFAKGETVITIDDDLQVPSSEITRLVGTWQSTHADLVYGYYTRKKHAALRNLGSASLKKSSKVFHGSPGEGSSFRLLTGDLVKKILHHHQSFIYLDEVFLWYTEDIAFTEVIHLPRKYKQSGYTFRKLMSLAANILLYYTTVPLKVLVYGGFLLSLFSFSFGLFYIFKKLLFDVPLGYTSLITAILFSTSILLFSLGVIGEYLSRIYQVQNRKPAYSIKKIL